MLALIGSYLILILLNIIVISFFKIEVSSEFIFLLPIIEGIIYIIFAKIFHIENKNIKNKEIVKIQNENPYFKSGTVENFEMFNDLSEKK